MIDDFAKAYLHHQLRTVREVLVWKLDGLSEYDIRRPLTATGTNLLGLVKHRAYSDARYFGEVFGRPFPGPVPQWNEVSAWETTIGPPPRRRVRTFWRSTRPFANTWMRRSTRCPSTRWIACLGGRART